MYFSCILSASSASFSSACDTQDSIVNMRCRIGTLLAAFSALSIFSNLFAKIIY